MNLEYHYKLIKKKVVKVRVYKDGKLDDKKMAEWADWFERANRHVRVTEVGDKYTVSTVFLGMDHNFGRGRRPALFETMVFKQKPKREKIGGHYRYIHESVDDVNDVFVGGRAGSYVTAITMHNKTVRILRSAIKKHGN